MASASPSRRHFSTLSLLTAASLWLGGCFARAPLPELRGQELPAPAAEALLQRLAEKDREVASLRAVSRASVEAGGEKRSLRYALIFEKPDKLRLEAFPPNANYSLSLLTARDGAVQLLDPGNREALVSSSGAELIRAHFYIPADERDLMSLMAGRIPAGSLERALGQGARVLQDEGSGTFTIVRGDFEDYWLLDARSLELRRVQLRSAKGAELELDMQFGEYHPVDGVSLPRGFQISIADERLRADFEFTSQKVNLDLPDALFDVPIPGDYEVRKE